MKITDVKVFPVNEDRLKAYVSLTFEACFVVRDIKIIQGPSGLFVAMPSKKRKDGQFRDICHPLNQDMRKVMEDAIFAAYEETMGDGAGKIERQPNGVHPDMDVD